MKVIYQNMNIELFNFYKGIEVNIDGNSIETILGSSIEEFEAAHNFVQWLLPLPEASQYNPSAPLLDNETIQAMKDDDECMVNLNRVYSYFKNFLESHDSWVTKRNHNFQRITRAIRCLVLFNRKTLAKNIYCVAVGALVNHPDIVDDGTLNYWEDALDGRVPGPSPLLKWIECGLPYHYNYSKLEEPMYPNWEDYSLKESDDESSNEITELFYDEWEKHPAMIEYNKQVMLVKKTNKETALANAHKSFFGLKLVKPGVLVEVKRESSGNIETILVGHCDHGGSVCGDFGIFNNKDIILRYKILYEGPLPPCIDHSYEEVVEENE